MIITEIKIMRMYVVVYLSEGGMHYRYRCYAKSKAEARKICRKALGIDNKIVEVENED